MQTGLSPLEIAEKMGHSACAYYIRRELPVVGPGDIENIKELGRGEFGIVHHVLLHRKGQPSCEAAVRQLGLGASAKLVRDLEREVSVYVRARGWECLESW